MLHTLPGRPAGSERWDAGEASRPAVDADDIVDGVGGHRPPAELAGLVPIVAGRRTLACADYNPL